MRLHATMHSHNHVEIKIKIQVLGRDFEDMCAQMYYRGKMFGFVHLYCGQEAVSTGVLRAMEPRDYACSTYRDHVHALSKVRERLMGGDCLEPGGLKP